MFALALERAFRSITKTPGVSILVVLAIALGVGITMPMVTLYHHIGGDPLRGNSDKLYRVLINNWPKDRIFRQNDPDFPTEIMTARDARALTHSKIPSKIALSYSFFNFVGPAGEHAKLRPFYTEVRVTTRDFFDMFRLPLQFGAAWDQRAADATQNVAVINDATNQHLFGGGNNVGKQFKIAGKVYTIVGILAPWSLTPRVYDMTQTSAQPEGVYIPLSDFRRSRFLPDYFRTYEKKRPQTFDASFLNGENLFAQLWVELDSPQQVSAYRDFMASYVADQKSLGRLQGDVKNRLYSAHDWVNVSPTNRYMKRLYGVFIVVGVCFLLVCLFNLLSLLLTKFMAVTPEACVMRALGASRTLIFLQYTQEVILLGICGGLLSIGVAKAALKGIFWVYIQNLPPELRQVQAVDPTGGVYIRLDSTLLVYTLALAIVASLAAALYPAWRSCRIAPADYLKVN